MNVPPHNNNLPYTRTVSRASAFGRSAADYSSEADLRSALESNEESHDDWRLPVHDPEAEEQTVEGELKRLWTLKSYLLLDAEKEEAFDRITEQARHVYNVPTSLISLVDLGRQFLFSNTGNPGDSRESSRDIAFCAHTILNKNGILVVNDTTKDERFKNNVLVTEPPFLRFYAAAPLVSPEGYKIGTFCVEGPDPRPEGLSHEEQIQLKSFADQAMELMVQRRDQLSEKLRGPIALSLRLHASVTTNLGRILYFEGELHAAMRLFQESVQTLMWEDDTSLPVPSVDRQQEMMQLLSYLSIEDANHEPTGSRTALLQRLCTIITSGDDPTCQQTTLEFETKKGNPAVVLSRNGIPGLFSEHISLLKGYGARRHENALIFTEAFQISLDRESNKNEKSVDFRNFIIPLNQCAKATLFNMGLIHYLWRSPDTAMQFFDLAASLSQANTPLTFDPVVLGCLNNMAQINLQYGRPNDASALLSDALTRGNAALAAMYEERGESDAASPSDFELDMLSRRLRRKLARTVMNMGHVHYFNCDYDASLQTCMDAMKLLHATNFDDAEAAAAWYNIAMLNHLKGNYKQTIENLDKFLDLAARSVGVSPPQVACALHRKGLALFGMEDFVGCMVPLWEALTIRRTALGDKHEDVAESLVLIGKVLQSRQDFDAAYSAISEAVSILVHSQKGEHALDTALALLELGKVLHSLRKYTEAIKAYEDVLDKAQEVFGQRHPFIARLLIILGNLYVEVKDTNRAEALFTQASQINMEHGLPTTIRQCTDPISA